jgi:flagellar biosynthetic protein FlhB
VFYFLSSPGRFRAFFESILNGAIRPEADFVALIRQAGFYFLVTSAPIFIVAVLAALFGNFLQGLPIFASEAPALKWDRLNPVQGLSRLKTKVSPAEWAKMSLLVGALGLIVWKTLAGHWGQVITSPAQSMESSNTLIRSMTLQVVLYAGISVGILAVADFFLQRRRFEKSIKQTKAEVKEDMKALEGNPLIKGKIRSIQREQARRRMMARVKEADVIVTDPTHLAVALAYKPGQKGAPRVIAKGQDLIAERIKELGREHDIPTVENVPLTPALHRTVEVEEEIPAELYKPVADVLAQVYRVRKSR